MIILTNREAKSRTYKLVVVGCMHGNEVFGMEVLRKLVSQIHNFPSLKIIIANVLAYKKGRRFIDSDLNRSFPGNNNGNHEERLAKQLLLEIGNAEFVVDLHTTTSPGFKSSIITGPMTNKIKTIVNATSIKHIAIMNSSLLSKSLIGNVKSGVSIELGVNYAKSLEAFNLTKALITNLIKVQKEPPKSRDIYKVLGTIPKSTVLPKNSYNFIYNSELGSVPFLIREKHYKDIHGFALEREKAIYI